MRCQKEQIQVMKDHKENIDILTYNAIGHLQLYIPIGSYIPGKTMKQRR